MDPLLKPLAVFSTAIFLILTSVPNARAGQKENAPESQLPAELRGAKIFHLSDHGRADQVRENLVTYKQVTYKDISTERLLLNVYVRLQPMDRDATVTKLYFQNVQAGGFPVHLQTFDQEFKVLKNQAVDLPAPLECSVVYSDLDSVSPLRDLVEKDRIRITGESFVEVRLNTLQKLLVGSKDVVIPVKFAQEVPLQMFPDSPLLKLAATKVLDLLSDPSTTAALSLAKEHVAKLAREHTLSSAGQGSVYLLYCEYALKNPATGASEKFAQSGTGFVVSSDGKLLTAKRVVQPWKFDPQVAYLMEKYHLEPDPQGYKLAAWPAGAQVQLPDGSLNFQTALTQAEQTLQILKIAPDRAEKTEYKDPDSGENATVSLDAGGENDWALLQMRGGKFQPIAMESAGDSLSPVTLLAFPYGLSQSSAAPKLVDVKVTRQGNQVTLDEPLEPGESGGPLMNGEGKVIALAGGAKQCVPVESLLGLIQ
jgi:Trypsin-like peptidase domain